MWLCMWGSALTQQPEACEVLGMLSSASFVSRCVSRVSCVFTDECTASESSQAQCGSPAALVLLWCLRTLISRIRISKANAMMTSTSSIVARHTAEPAGKTLDVCVCHQLGLECKGATSIFELCRLRSDSF